MTKTSHGPEHYRMQRIRASETGLVVRHYRILPEDIDTVDELVRPYKEKADDHFRRVRREQKRQEKLERLEKMRAAAAPPAPPQATKAPPQVVKTPSEPAEPTRSSEKKEEPKERKRPEAWPLPEQKKRETLKLSFRKAS